MTQRAESLPKELAAIVLENIRDGMMVTDAENRIIYVNRAFTQVTGYTAADVLGQSPSVLKSGRHNKAFYNRMWRSLKSKGNWQGDIWDKRKNGEVYLEHLTISAVKDASGQATHYVAVFTDINELRTVQEKLQRMAHFDVLTELPNRSQMNERLHQLVDQAARDNLLLALIFLDMDGFKQLNDRFGSVLGDRILVMVGQRLKQVARSTDVVARLGGDEFALVLCGLPNMDEIERVAERILALMAAPFSIDGKHYDLSASLGITVFPFDSSDTANLLRHADQAMYQAKQAGRNRYHLFDTEQDQQAQTRRQLLDRLAEALSNDELVLHYQPKVNLRTGQVVGAEALLRWQHPERGLLLPHEFLPRAEHDDLIVDIGEWVTRQALAQIVTWEEAGCPLSVSVNLSARQLLREDFVSCVQGCLAEYPGVPKGRLEMEILESAALENTRHVQSVIKACRSMGVGFALDDFGTGYASLSYLRDIPADVLKIDQSFVRDLLEDRDDLTLVEGVISLATAFRRTVVAEGVETSEQGVLLMRMGCDIAQGYVIARPMPAGDIPAWVAAYRPDPQWALWADTEWEMNDFPLLVAQYDHVKWVQRVLHHLDGGELAFEGTELCDHQQCRFGHWYYGHGRKRYGRMEAFRELEPIHVAVHSLGPEIVKLRQSGNIKAAKAKIPELLSLKDTILEKLAVLQASVAGQAA